MRVADFDFELPEAQIAQEARPRGASRLLVVRRATGTWEERPFRDLPVLLDPGDVIVANDTRVFPARLVGRRDPSGERVECLLLERESPTDWSALVHPGQKLKVGARMVFEDVARAPVVRIDGEVLARRFYGRRLVRLTATGAVSVDDAVDALGQKTSHWTAAGRWIVGGAYKDRHAGSLPDADSCLSGLQARWVGPVDPIHSAHWSRLARSARARAWPTNCTACGSDLARSSNARIVSTSMACEIQ